MGHSPWGHKLDMTERLRSLSLCPPHCKMGVAPLSLDLFHLVEAQGSFKKFFYCGKSHIKYTILTIFNCTVHWH